MVRKLINLKFFIVFAIVNIISVGLITVLFNSFSHKEDLPKEYKLKHYETKKYQNTDTSKSTIVKIGIFPMEIYEIDFQRNTYKMAALIWLVWNPSANIDGMPIIPPESLEILNLVDTWDFHKQVIVNEEMINGEMYHAMKINGTFFHPFEMSKYPLDEQVLPIILEDNLYVIEELTFKPDLIDTRLQDGIFIPGWNIEKIQYKSDSHTYDTKFGYYDDYEKYSYSQLEFSVVIKRPVQFFLFKFVFPLSIILIFSLLAYWVPLNQFEVRIALSGSALLNIIFLQQLHADDIITARQLVLLDILYIFCYIAVLITLIFLIYSNERYLESQQKQKITKYNKILFTGHVIIFICLVLYLFLSNF